MKFPIQCCISTSYLNKEKYDWLLTKLISDGYHWPSNFDKSGFFDMWKYIGVNQHGDIMLHDYKEYYLDYPEDPFYNVLSKEWLEQYLAN